MRQTENFSKCSEAKWEYRRNHAGHHSGESVQIKRFFPRPPSIILVFSGDCLKDCLHFLSKAAWKYRREHANYDSNGESGQLKNIYFWFWFASQCSRFSSDKLKIFQNAVKLNGCTGGTTQSIIVAGRGCKKFLKSYPL